MAALLLDPVTLTITLAAIGVLGTAWAVGRVALGMEG